MLQKLRSRHPIDLPVDGYGRKRGILAVMGGLAVLFLFVPLVVSLLGGLARGGTIDVNAGTAVAAGVGLLVLVVLVGGLIGKVGADRR